VDVVAEVVPEREREEPSPRLKSKTHEETNLTGQLLMVWYVSQFNGN